MDPETSRTRRRRDNGLIKPCKQLKKPKTISVGKTDQAGVDVSPSPPASLGSSRSLSSSAKISACNTRRSSSSSPSSSSSFSSSTYYSTSVSSFSATPSPVAKIEEEDSYTSRDRRDVQEDNVSISLENRKSASFTRIVVVSSSTESEEEDLNSSSDGDSVDSVSSESNDSKHSDLLAEDGESSSECDDDDEKGRVEEIKSGEDEGDDIADFEKEDEISDEVKEPMNPDPENTSSSGADFKKLEQPDPETDSLYKILDLCLAGGDVDDAVDLVVDDAQRCARRKRMDHHDHDVEEADAGDDVEDADHRKESGVEGMVKKIDKKVMMHPNNIGKRRPFSTNEIRCSLYNSIMEDGSSDELEDPMNLHGTEDTSSSSDDSGEDTDTVKSEQPERESDTLYKMLDFCLACDDDGDNNNTAHLNNEDHLLGNAKTQQQLCKAGNHCLILDEEIGIICESCGIVREEIKHVTAPFHNNMFGESERSNYYSYDYRDAGGLSHFEDPNCEYQHYQDDSSFDPTGTVWEIIPGLRRTLLPHQREAFEFLWRKVAGGTKLAELKRNENVKKSDGGGCLISHAPGTGKTRLTIAFLEAYMKLYKKSRPVIIAPASILLTWKKEFKKWKVGIPFINMNDDELSAEEIAMATSLYRIEFTRNLTLLDKRMIKLLVWRKHESVLAISYTLFSQLAGEDNVIFRKKLLHWPDLLVLDEGHMPRNDRSNMFKVLSEVETKKRFILSGTPFQNNFRELHNILCLVRPEFNREKNPFKSCVDKADEDNIRELKANMKPISHCYDGYVVSAMVPGLVDNIIYLEPSLNQKTLLKDFEHNKNHFEVNVDNTLISVHPMLFYCKKTNPDFAQELKSRRWDLADGAKTIFLKRLIELSSALEERVLVFSQYLDPLNFVKAVLKCSDFGWREGREILVMSGKQDMETRKRDMDLFNKPGSEAKVMLASTKACSEGIELTGASRVVLLDVTWNPSVERQAISRAYRIGQEKVVHVYHLIMTDNDSNRHICQTQKNKFSNYVFSSTDKKKNVPASSEPDCEDIILERLLEEKVVKAAIQQKKNEHGLVNHF